MRKKVSLLLLAITLIALLIMSKAYAASLTLQVATNKLSYSQGGTVTIRAIAQKGLTRIQSSDIRSSQITIKDPNGMVKVSPVAMLKDSKTGLCYYNFRLSPDSQAGKWLAAVTITDRKGNSGTGIMVFRVRGQVPDHSKLIEVYEGTKTCIKSGCHADQALDMFNSVHYQWQGNNSRAIELAQDNSTASKMGGINDFCIWPDGNWLTVFKKANGTTGPGGCAVCHAGLGLKPSNAVSDKQLENIDCLICHAPNYSRKVALNSDSTFSIVPADGVDILKAAQSVTRPTRDMCMRCHEKSGGGNNYKRGDIESTIKSCAKEYDVHMGSKETGGQDFNCQDCHLTESHKIAGRGSDMRALDSKFELNCEVCHTKVPHRSYSGKYADLNRHTEKVNCTVCHIPSFAKSVATDMFRDWQEMELDADKQLYDPVIVKAKNVMPVYAWFNGYSHFYRFRDPVALDERGVQKMSWPDGDLADPKAKIHAFKLHKALQPMESKTMQLLPLKNKIAFEEGKVNEAIAIGAYAAGMTYESHVFIPTERYMGIFHTVGPAKSTALSCSNQPCHGNENRIPFTKLGYQRRGTNDQLCDVCHELKSNPGFTSLHSEHREGGRYCLACHGGGYPLNGSRATICSSCHSYKSITDPNRIHVKHVRDKRYDCAKCHTFSGGNLVK